MSNIEILCHISLKGVTYWHTYVNTILYLKCNNSRIFKVDALHMHMCMEGINFKIFIRYGHVNIMGLLGKLLSLIFINTDKV
jgi:hypothetical protein